MKNQTTIKKLEKYNLTKFQKKVLIATMSIKSGETRSYKQIAEQIGSPNAYRAVGSALKKNPLTVEIPCHASVKLSFYQSVSLRPEDFLHFLCYVTLISRNILYTMLLHTLSLVKIFTCEPWI